MLLPRRLVDAHRRDVATLTSIARNDLRLLLARYDDPVKARDALLVALPTIINIYGSASATLAADWYAEMRDGSKARGRFTPATADLPDASRADALARWGVSPLFSAEPDKLTTLAKLGGGLQRIVADADRQTITVSSVEDRAARGWQRSTDGGCAFCQSLADITFTNEPTFASHDDCACVAVPVFG